MHYLDFFELEVSQLVHGERFKCRMEKGDRMQPLQWFDYRIPINQQTSEQQAI